MLSCLILSAVNAGLSMVWILAFNIYIALWTKATETSKREIFQRAATKFPTDTKPFQELPCPTFSSRTCWSLASE